MVRKRVFSVLLASVVGALIILIALIFLYSSKTGMSLQIPVLNLRVGNSFYQAEPNNYIIDKAKAELALKKTGYRFDKLEFRVKLAPDDQAYSWRNAGKISLSSLITPHQDTLIWELFIDNDFLSGLNNPDQQTKALAENNINRIILNSFFTSSPKASETGNAEEVYPELSGNADITEDKIFSLKL